MEGQRYRLEGLAAFFCSNQHIYSQSAWLAEATLLLNSRPAGMKGKEGLWARLFILHGIYIQGRNAKRCQLVGTRRTTTSLHCTLWVLKPRQVLPSSPTTWAKGWIWRGTLLADGTGPIRWRRLRCLRYTLPPLMGLWFLSISPACCWPSPSQWTPAAMAQHYWYRGLKEEETPGATFHASASPARLPATLHFTGIIPATPFCILDGTPHAGTGTEGTAGHRLCLLDPANCHCWCLAW